MNMTLFGGTGRTGKYFIRMALAEGHQVTAYVRNPAKLDISDPNLTVITGAINDSEKIAAAITGTDVVISTLGPARGSPPGVMTAAAAHITAAMKEKGVSRILFTTGAGVASPDDKPDLMSKVMGFLLKRISGAVLQDSLEGAALIQNSGLAWTIVRGPMLQDKPFDGNYQVGYVGEGMNRTLSRGNFAGFLLKEAKEGEYLHKMPAVSDI